MKDITAASTTLTLPHSPYRIYSADEALEQEQQTQKWTVYPDETDQVLLASVNRFLISTSLLLFGICQHTGLAISRDALGSRLKKLFNGGLLVRFHFASSSMDAASATRVYALSETGREYLRRIGAKIRLSGYIEKLDVPSVKRLLASQAFLLSQRDWSISDVSAAAMVAERSDVDAKANGHLFRTNLMLRSAADAVWFIDAVRRTPDGESDLIRKLKRVDDTVACNNLNISLAGKRPKVILVAEDPTHMTSLMRAVKKLRRPFRYDIVFTNDYDVYSSSGNADDCMYSIELESSSFLEHFRSELKRLVG